MFLLSLPDLRMQRMRLAAHARGGPAHAVDARRVWQVRVRCRPVSSWPALPFLIASLPNSHTLYSVYIIVMYAIVSLFIRGLWLCTVVNSPQERSG
jgi:hypothetical protein